MNEDIELTGIVTKFDYVNPHSWLHLEVTGADGIKKEYACYASTLIFADGTTLDRYGQRIG